MSKQLAPHTTHSPPLREMTPAQLAAHCQNIQPDASHEPFCFELFRRAIIENCSLCWHYLYNQYYPLVRYWISRRVPSDHDTIDDLTQETFLAFWRFYTPSKLAYARGLQDILSYLKSCAASAIAQARRKADRRFLEAQLMNEQTVDASLSVQSAEITVLEQIAAQNLWAVVEACCNDERDRLVVRFILLAGLKPRHLVAQFPDLFPEVSEVYRVKRNLLDRLRRAPTIQSLHEN